MIEVLFCKQLNPEVICLGVFYLTGIKRQLLCLKHNQEGFIMSTKKITRIAVLAAIACVLQYLARLIPFKVGGFLEIDISDFPAIIGALALGPVSGVLVELIKNLLHLPVSETFYVGELANFLVNGIFVFTIGYIYKAKKTKGGAVCALIGGTLIMTAAAMLANRYILLPLYIKGADTATYWHTIFAFITPFNFIRGIVLSVVTFLSYKKLRILLK